MTLLFTCRKCGLQAPTLEGHRCVVASSERLEAARKVLSEASERTGVEYRPPRDLPMPKAEYQVLAQPSQKAVTEAVTPSRGFDRAAYHKAYMKAYMRAYMRGWRARRKAK